MALVALSKTEDFEFVSDKDPCKVHKNLPVNKDDPKSGTYDTTVIEPGATIFVLRPLDVFLMGDIYDKAMSISMKQLSTDGDAQDIDIKSMMNTTNIEAAKYGLVGWSNFTDSKGKELPFVSRSTTRSGREYVVAADESLNMLGTFLIQELAEAIKESSQVSGDLEKK